MQILEPEEFFARFGRPETWRPIDCGGVVGVETTRNPRTPTVNPDNEISEDPGPNPRTPRHEGDPNWRRNNDRDAG